MGTTLFFSVLFCIVIITNGQDDPCGIGKKEGDVPFPMDAFDMGWSYEIEYIAISPHWEVIYFESLYNPFLMSGRLTQRRKNETEVFTYFDRANELYYQKSDTCLGETLNGTQPFEKLPNNHNDWILNTENGEQVLFGPTTMFFRAALLDSSTNPIIYKGLLEKDIRGNTPKVWKQCIETDLYTYYFTENNVPLKVVIEKNKQAIEVFNFYQFDPGFEVSIKIPLEAGCMKINPEKFELPPMVDGDLFLEGEIVYVDHIYPPEEMPKPFIIDFGVAFDEHSKTVALTHENWQNKMGEDIANLHPYRRVYTENTGIFYSINLKTRQCTIETTDESPLNIQLPDSSYLVLNDMDIFDNEGYAYQGTEYVDEIPIEIFEKKIESYMMGGERTWNSAIITRMLYAAGVREYDVEYRALKPYKIVLKLFDDRRKLAREIVVNIFNYLNTVPNKLKRFNIDDCEKHMSDSQWFKMIFTPHEKYYLKGRELMDEVMSRDTDIVLQFTNKLATHSELHPSRISNVLLDYTCDNLNIYGKILGRASSLLLFDEISKERINVNDDYIPATDENECSEICIDRGICDAFSFCDGKACVISLSGDDGYTSENDTDCILYKFKKGLRREPSSKSLIKQFNDISGFQLAFIRKLPNNIYDAMFFEHHKDMTENDWTRESFPSIVLLAKGSSFQMFTEINNRTEDEGSTVQITEYYNFEEGMGKTIYAEKGQTKEMFFSVETNELFTVKPDHCFAQPLNESMPFGLYERDQFHKNLIYVDDQLALIGPSALLYKAFEKSLKASGSIYYEGPNYDGANDVRGIPSQIWVDCGDPEIVYKYYFSKPTEENELPIPLKISIESENHAKTKVNLTYEFFNFMTDIDNRIVKLPYGKGCERLDPESDMFPPFPMLSVDSDLFIRAEVVFDDRAKEGSKFITNFMIAKDSKTPLGAFSANNKTELSTTLFRTVFNKNVQITIDESNGVCNIEQKDVDIAEIYLPGQFHLSVDENIIFGGNGYSFIDQYKVMGLSTVVYEKVITDYALSPEEIYPKAIVTRFFLDNENKFTDEEKGFNAPIKTHLKLYRADNQTFVLDKVITFNFYEVKTNIINKPEIFNIETCMVDEDSYSRFQIMYPLKASENFNEILTFSKIISTRFLSDILDTAIITPARISPHVQVTASGKRLMITAKLLERTSPLYDYNIIEGVQIKTSGAKYRVYTREECANLCINSERCTTWSFCDMDCSISYTFDSDVPTKKNSTCSTFKLDEEFYVGSQEISMISALDKIKALAEGGKLTIDIPPLENGAKVGPFKSFGFISDIHNNETDYDDVFPMENFEAGFSLQVEYTPLSGSGVVYFESVFDPFELAGKITQNIKNEKIIFNSFQYENDLFSQKDNKCTSEPLDKSNPFKSLPNKPDWIYKYENSLILGPVSLFYKAYDIRKTNPIINHGKGPRVRGRPTRVWKQVVKPDDYTFYFDENTLEPLRIDIDRDEKPFEMLNFYAFDEGFEESLMVPFDSGCQRINPDMGEMPQLGHEDLFVQGEIVYTNHIHPRDETPQQFIIDFKVAFDKLSESFALNHETWRNNVDEKDILNLHPYKRVYTEHAGISYSINQNTRQCTIETTDTIPLFVELPDGSSLFLNDKNLLERKGYHFQGSVMVDDIAVDVFEKMVKPFTMGFKTTWTSAIITRMQYADDMKNGIEYKALTPYRFIVKLYDSEDKLAREIIINIFSFFQNFVPNKMKQFDIENCEKNLSPSTWFKMIFSPSEDFSLRGHQLMEEIMSRDIDIELQVTSDLAYNSELHPQRLSKILLDYTCDNLNVYGKVLGTPPSILLFDQKVNERITGPSSTVTTENEEECSNLCVKYNCVSFSFCDGVTCILGNSSDGSTTVVDDAKCISYETRNLLKPESSPEDIIQSFFNIENLGLVFIKKMPDGKEDVITFLHNKDLSRQDFDMESFPDISFLVKGASFQLITEIQNKVFGKDQNNIQTTEFYNFKSGKGKTMYTSQDQVKEMYFYPASNQLYVINDNKCQLQKLNESSPFGPIEHDQYRQDLVYQDEQVALVGPSALLMSAFEKSVQQVASIYYEGPCATDIRGIQCQVWVDCSDSDVIYKFYFSKPSKTDDPIVPLRVTAETEANADYNMNITYEMVKFSSEVDERIFDMPHEKCNDPCDIGNKVGDDLFPVDIFQAGFSYQVEYTSISPKSEVLYFESIYSPFEKAGALAQHRTNKTISYVYFQEQKDMFTIKDNKCYYEPLELSNPFENIPNKPDWFYWKEDKMILGPVSLFFRASDYNNTDAIIYRGLGPRVRGRNTKIWKQCVKPYVYTFYFDEKAQEPLRIDIHLNGELYQILNFYEFDAGFDESIMIPYEYGCQRTKPDKVDIPSWHNQDLFINGEIIFTNSIHDPAEVPKQYIIDYQIAYDKLSKTSALTHETWRSNFGDDIIDLHSSRRVYTDDSGIVYSINRDTRQCTIETTDETPLYVDLPDKSLLFLNDKDIVESEGYEYIGYNMVDDIAVDIFQKKVKPFSMGDKRSWNYAIITRMHYAEQVKNGLEYKSLKPFKTVLKLYDSNNKLSREIVNNHFIFMSRIPNKGKQFNIEDCERNLSPSTWFKMIFSPEENYNLRGNALIEEIMTRDLNIKHKFTTALESHSELRPARLADVLIDYSCDNMNIYGKILGRAPSTLYFIEMDKQTIIGPTDYKSAKDEVECSSLCVDNNLCGAFSFCDVGTCILSISSDGGYTAENDTTCMLYKFREDLKPEQSSEKLIQSFYSAQTMQLAFEKKLPNGETDVIFFKHNNDRDRNDFDIETFPNLRSLANDAAFQMTSELNNRKEGNNGETIQINEYYNFIEGIGKTVYSEKGQRKEMYFFAESNELFILKSDRCTTEALNKSLPFEFYTDRFKLDLIYQRNGAALIGPSALLLKAYEKSLNEAGSVYYEGPGKINIRGIPCQVWVDCSDTDVVYKYYFSKPDRKEDSPVPLKITVESVENSKFNVNLTYELFNFNWKVEEAILTLPHGKGCTRLDPDDDTFPTLPSVPVDADYFIKAEVVFNDLANDGAKMMSNFFMAHDFRTRLTAYSITEWALIDNETIVSRDLKRNVFLKNIQTIIDDSNGNCYTLNEANPAVQIKFPGGFSLDMDQNIFFGGEDYSYIDQFTERNLQTIVFEKEIKDYQVGPEKKYAKAIITRFFLEEENKFIDEKKLVLAPLRTRIQLFNADKEAFILDKIVSFNFYEFKTTIVNKPKYFNIEACRSDRDSYRWFQVMYPYKNKEDFQNILAEEGSIASTFLFDLLMKGIITPARISPQVEVDITKDYVVVTAKLLERTSPLYDYDLQEGVKIANIDESHSVLTKEECANLCISSGKCVTWSICNMACYISYNSETDVTTTKNPICSTYKLDDLYDLGSQEIPLASALDSIKDMAVGGQLTIVLPPLKDQTKLYSLKSSSFSVDIPINKNTLEDERFTIAVEGKKYDSDILKEVTYLGDIYHDKCFEYCNAMDQCLSLSMCRLDSSCTMYSKHPSEVDAKYFKVATDCDVFEKKYSSSFTLFPGHSIVGVTKNKLVDKTLEQCAASCFKETSFNCLSFDYCEDKKECSLYEEHVTKGTADRKLKESTCNHYSRKFLYDFDSIRNKKVMEEQEVIQDVDLDACSKNCIENSGMSCRSFDFCFKGNGLGKCILSSKSEEKVSLVSSPSCDHHYRKIPLARAKQLYTSSLAGAMSFLFIIFGMLIGIAAVFTYKTYKRS